MGYFIGLNNRQIFVEEDGTFWESPAKKHQYSEKELFPEKFTETETVSETTTTIEPPVETSSTLQDVINKLTCPNCNYQAKSIAGLAAHRFKKQH